VTKQNKTNYDQKMKENKEAATVRGGDTEYWIRMAENKRPTSVGFETSKPDDVKIITT